MLIFDGTLLDNHTGNNVQQKAELHIVLGVGSRAEWEHSAKDEKRDGNRWRCVRQVEE